MASRAVPGLSARLGDLPVVRGHAPWPGHEYARGWGVFALPFDSGHVLALRVFPQSDFGPYRAVWHRDPDNRWSIHVDGQRLDTACRPTALVFHGLLRRPRQDGDLPSAPPSTWAGIQGTYRSRMTVMESYVEHPPLPGLAGVVRTVWVQRTGEAAYVQRHLPTGGVELHFPVGGHPQLLGPLTGPVIEVIPARTTIVGVRFQPGAAPPLPTVLDDLVDQRLGLAELWGSSVDRLAEAMAKAETPQRALVALQAHLLQEFRSAGRVDSLVREAVKVLMPWNPVNVDTLAAHLALSASQLRRRRLHAVGVSPKVLQRTLRFQGFSRWLRLAPPPRAGVVRTAWRDWPLMWGTPTRHT